MSRGCARITKPPYTPPRGTCLFVNLLLDWELPIISAWVLRTNVSIRKLTLPPTYTFSSLFGTVHCPFSPRELAHTSPVHPNPWHDMLCHHKPHYIIPQNSHHTYLQGISIAFPRYIAMQHPPSHDLIFMSYMLLAWSMSRMLVGPCPNHCYMTR